MTEAILPRRLSLCGREVRIDEVVARSATSIVYRGQEIATAAPVAVKVFADADVAAHEAEILHMLTSAPVPRVIGDGAVDGRRCLLLSWVEGRSLTSLCAGAPEKPQPGELRAILIGVAKALAALHRLDIIHVDLKPEHVVVGPDGSVTLTDLSAARRSSATDTAGTGDHSPGVAAPEQISGAGEGPWTDIYGFGVLLHWILTGHLPGSDGALSRDDPCHRLVQRCLAEDPQDRPASAEALVSELRALEPTPAEQEHLDPFPETVRIRTRMTGEVPAGAPDAGLSATRPRRRDSWKIVAALVLLLLAGAGAGVALWPLYERHYKTQWVIDPAGGGDALTLAEVLERGGDLLRIELAAGRHVFTEIVGREVEVVAVPGLQEPPVIAASTGACAELSNAIVSFTGVVFDGSGSAPRSDCVHVEGGALTLSDVRIENPTGSGLVSGRGARLTLNNLSVKDAAGNAMRLDTGVSAQMSTVTLEQSGAAGIILMGGAHAEIDTLRVSGADAAGIAVGGGATVDITGLKLEATIGTGVEIAEGAAVRIRGGSVSQTAGAGIAVYDGASLTLETVEIRQTVLTALYVDGASVLRLSDTSVTGSQEHGVLLLALKEGRLERLSVTENEGVGVVIFPGASVEIADAEIAGNDGGDLIDGRPKDDPPESEEKETDE